jgi:hypothetical protein
MKLSGPFCYVNASPLSDSAADLKKQCAHTIGAVELTIRAHITQIQEQIDALTAGLKDAKDPLATMEAESHIRSLNLALAHYQLALQIEEDVRVAQARAGSKGS